MKLKNIIAAAALGLVTVLGVSTAHAVENDWNLNLSVVNGTTVGATTFDNLGDATDIDHINVTGTATVNQTVVGGSALGQPFVDTGHLQFDTYTKEGAALTSQFVNPNGHALYLSYVGLTGTLNADGSITFDPGSGVVQLVLDSDLDANPATGDVLVLATFDIVAPSGGSNLDFFGGTAANSTIDVTLDLVSSVAGLFTDTLGNEFDPDLTLHLVNTDSLLDPNFSPNPDNSGVDGAGNGVSVIHVQNNGQYNITVPEPGTLALLGAGLFGAAALLRRRNRTAA
jgi:hypothetical protein